MAVEDRIKRMVAVIESGQFADLSSFFHTDIVYERPGFDDIEGVDALLRFYTQIRPIRTGQHIVENIVSDADRAVAVGHFEGVLKDDYPARERFADTYRFKNGKIGHRRTFFYLPAV